MTILPRNLTHFLFLKINLNLWKLAVITINELSDKVFQNHFDKSSGKKITQFTINSS